MRNDFNSNYLEHHGILGMKWGERNGPPYPLDSSAKSVDEKKGRKSSGKAKENYKKARNILKSDSGSRSTKVMKEARRRDIDEISTDELKKINNRLNEEKRYAELTSGMTSEGKKFAKQISTQIATAIITGIAIEAGKAYVKKRLHI